MTRPHRDTVDHDPAGSMSTMNLDFVSPDRKDLRDFVSPDRKVFREPDDQNIH